MIDARFRSIDTWPYTSTEPYARRSRWSFKASWERTLALLDRELNMLDAHEIVVECFLAPGDIRLDGWPRERARTPSHPGVAVHFEAPDVGHLRYATDAYEIWQHNLRAIALGLQALRAVDRYGITHGREQYRGFAALPPGIPMPEIAPMSAEEAARFIAEQGHDGVTPAAILNQLSTFKQCYRMAARKLHPDAGGKSEDFARLQEARRVLDEWFG